MTVQESRPGIEPGRITQEHSAQATSVTSARESKAQEIWRRLDAVTDPELDESVVDLAFVTHVDVDDDDCVRIGFRLPTYWCAANFAFMMADDMRVAAEGAPWVRRATVALGEHMYADTINSGIAEGRSFQDSFGKEADGDLEEVRRTFLLKSFQRRQEALLVHLGERGHAPGALVALRLGQLDPLANDDDGRRLIARYLHRRGVAGPATPDALAFVTTAGDPLAVEGYETYVKGLRRVRVNAEFNGALCRGLLAVRFDEPEREPALS